MPLLATWNIQWGGQERIERIVEDIEQASPDLLVITEYQSGKSDSLLAMLHARGWSSQAYSAPPGRNGGVAVVARSEFEILPVSPELAPFASRVLAVRWQGLEAIGVYAPSEHPANEFWLAFTTAIRDRARDTVVLGDLNTGVSLLDSPRDDFFCSEHFAQLKSDGMIDLFRAVHSDAAREFSWYSSAKNGHRLDHALGTPSVAASVLRCEYAHGPRERGASDHSMLLVELAS